MAHRAATRTVYETPRIAPRPGETVVTSNDKTEEEWVRELTRDAIDDFEAFRECGLARMPAPGDGVAFAKAIRDPCRP